MNPPRSQPLAKFLWPRGVMLSGMVPRGGSTGHPSLRDRCIHIHTLARAHNLPLCLSQLGEILRTCSRDHASSFRYRIVCPLLFLTTILVRL